MYKLLSYYVKTNNPKYPGHPGNEFESVLKIEKGNICNSTRIKLFTHNDTHIDSPYHYNTNGIKVHEISPDNFFYNKVAVANLEGKIGKEITISDVGKISDDADMLMIHTGISRYWINSPEEYVAKENQPWISRELTDYLIRESNIKGISVDFMSVDNIDDIENKDPFVHRVFLGMNDLSKIIFIYENVNIKTILNESVKKIYAFPLLLYGLDGAPVTMVAEI
ncbi:MAG: cyclase family protein [Actinomycetota bacterium]|jgi:kynurenine formamidase|nr:cyclase family protein [Actinomycetota bacterium]